MSYRREECKIWAKIPREDLEVICQELAYHYDVLLAFANGAMIETLPYGKSEWEETENPTFHISEKFRVKNPWKPKDGEWFFYIDITLQVAESRCNNFTNSLIFRSGNCFKTRAEAESARKRVLKALKG